MCLLPLAVMSVPLGPLQVMQIPVYLSDEIRTTVGSTVQTRNSKIPKSTKKTSHVTSRVHIQHVSEGDIRQWGFLTHRHGPVKSPDCGKQGFFFFFSSQL
uniref:Uncharacterized protein n=1 Tax=Micrurus carvalhoi TaxID=3147026 RepID=A0A2H6NER5_9SAUR